MSSLQQTFKYDGNPSVAPFNTVTLNFEIPTFEFVTVLVNRKPFIERNEVSSHLLNLLQDLSQTKYALDVPGLSFIGSSNSSILNFWRKLAQMGFVNDDPDLLDILSLKYNINILDEHNNLFGSLSEDALFSLATSSAKYKEITDAQIAINTAPSFNEVASAKLELEIIAYSSKNIFVINKNIFKDIISQFKTFAPDLNDYALLYIIAHLTDVSAGKPAFKIDTAEFKVFLKTYFGIDKPEIIKAISLLVKDNFSKLFDFPVTVPEVKVLAVKGTFKITAPGNAAVPLSDFDFYNLSVEYAIKAPEGNIHPASSTFEWDTLAVSELNINTVPFAFTPVITNIISSAVSVRVKGYEGSVLWQEEFAVTNTNLQHLEIEVPLLKPAVLPASNEVQAIESKKKLHGKVVELSGNCTLKALTVLIQTKKLNDTFWKVVGAAVTDGSGNFSMPYPYGNYTAAQALVSLTPNSPADIVIKSDEEHISSNTTIDDDFLYLLLKDAVCKPAKDEDDCDCHTPKAAGRLPDQEDLINSNDYMQDIGGSCVNLSTPNRTLSEHNFKTVVKTSQSDVANYVLSKDPQGNFSLKGGQTVIERRPVSLSNPIYWQDAPDNEDNLSLYQAVSVVTGHILHYKVTVKADGYSLGELLYSLPLAPGQKKEIVVFEQTHTLLASETQRLSQQESLSASLVNDISIADTLTGSINEATRGSSSATTSGVSGGFGLGAIIDAVGISIGVAGGVANANSTASQNSSRVINEHFMEQMRNGITQNAQSYRELNASVITTVQEGQKYGVTTEVIANHNHCHSLTMLYFEVLQHYAVYQDLVQVEECVLIPLLMTPFRSENIYKFREVLAQNLLPMPSETYLQPFNLLKTGRQHPLLKGFDAIERIKTNYVNVDYPEAAYDEEVINFITGEMFIRTNLPRPKTRYDRIKSFPVVQKDLDRGGFFGWMADGLFGKNTVNNVQPNIDDYITVDANFQSVPPKDCIRVINFGERFFESGGVDQDQWEQYAKLILPLLPQPATTVPDFLSYYFKDRLISEWDSIFYNDIAPLLFETIAKNLSIGEFSSLDFSTTAKYKGGDVMMRLNIRGNGSNKKRREIDKFTIRYNGPGAISSDLVTLIVQNLNIRYSTIHYNGSLFSGFLGDDLMDATEIPAPENANEKRNPRKEDQYLAAKLIEHLNNNIVHFNISLWTGLHKEQRTMLLDGFHIETYNDFGQPIGFRSLASVVKNELLGISGNSLIMPVAPGYKVDRTYVVEQPIEGPAREINLFDHYKPLTPAPPFRISVPNKNNGFFAEAVQGACDACEKVKDNTSQDWEKFKPDEPTAINPVTVPVPTVTDWKAAFKDFATPIVNIQNAPAAPTPGSSLAGLSELLGKSDVFKDITGLDANQKNAMQTYLSNQQNAKDFAQMAKELATQGHNTQHGNQIADSIRNSSELSDEEKAELLKKHYNQMIDGGQSEKAAQEADAQNDKPTLTEVAARAEEKGKPVKASKTESSGKSEEVDIGAGEAEVEDYFSQRSEDDGVEYFTERGLNSLLEMDSIFPVNSSQS